MRYAVNEEEFQRERHRYELRFCCEDCSFFVPALDRCAHFWPTADHRRARYESDDFAEVIFCKEFELK